MEHQDLKVINVGNGKKKSLGQKEIKPKNNVDLKAIKLENDTENFDNPKISKSLSQEIMNARNAKKINQKEMAIRLNVQRNLYNDIENGKALYDTRTKEVVNKIQRNLGVKFENFGKKKKII
jgi:ribosome-binding protein aMBF1 (putative translation factor)